MVVAMAEAKKALAKKARATKKKAPAKKAAAKPGAPVNKGGRPAVIDDERGEALLNALRLGTPLHVACQFAGVSDETLRLVRIRGNKALAVPPGERNPSERKYAKFIGDLDKAVVQAGVSAQRTIHSLMSQDVRSATPEQQRIAMSAAQFFLTHRLPDYYNTKISAELTGKNGGPLEVALTAEQAWEIVQAIQTGESFDVPEKKEAHED
jgi:hypothetical protein